MEAASSASSDVNSSITTVFFLVTAWHRHPSGRSLGEKSIVMPLLFWIYRGISIATDGFPVSHGSFHRFFTAKGGFRHPEAGSRFQESADPLPRRPPIRRASQKNTPIHGIQGVDALGFTDIISYLIISHENYFHELQSPGSPYT